jgi:hypothetical protein
MNQEQVNAVKGMLQAYSERNNSVLIGDKWYNTSGIDVAALLRFKRKAVNADLSEDGRFITKIELDATQQTFAPRRAPMGGRSEEESRRIARQASLNTATAIYSLALQTTAGTFSAPTNTSTVVVADAIKAEVMRIASELEAHVYR